MWPSDDFLLVGVLHLLPLPAGPGPSPGVAAVVERALRDAETLLEGGIGSCIVENLGDAPFTAGSVKPHVPAVLAVVADRLRQAHGMDLRVGLNILRNDAHSALGAAVASGAEFVRVNVLTGSVWTDQGLVEGRAHDVLRYRRALGMDPADSDVSIRVCADVCVKHGVPAGGALLRHVAADTAYRGRADVLIVSGEATGSATDLVDVRAVTAAIPDRPVWVGSGVTASSIDSVRLACHGAIVGTALHRDGVLTAPLDLDRVRAIKGA